MVFCALLGIADILAAWLLNNPGLLPSLAFGLGILHLVKGASSIAGALLTGFFLEIMGAIDLLTGIALLFAWNIPYLWIPLALKGIYSLIAGW